MIAVAITLDPCGAQAIWNQWSLARWLSSLTTSGQPKNFCSLYPLNRANERQSPESEDDAKPHLAASVIFFLPPLIACQLGELNEVAAGIVQHRNGRASHVGGRHRELGAARLDPLEVALDVVSEEHGGGLALLKDRLLIRFGRGVVAQRELQLSTVRLLGRGHGQPAKWALTEIGLLGKAQYLRIEAQGLVLVVHVYAGQFDFHFVSPLSRSRFGSRRLLLSLPLRWC